MGRPLDMYPDSFGSHRASVFPHVGPASYTQMTGGATPVTGGDTVEGAEAGMKYFDFVCGGISDDGLYEVVAVPLTASLSPGATPKPATPGQTYGLVWYTIDTRTQVTGTTDLSASVVRLFALGPK